MAAPPPGADPRPLVGEPLSLDLLNTRWIQGGRRHDLLTDLDGFAIWLATNGLADRIAATPAAHDATRDARAALAAVLAAPRDPAAPRDLNAVLDRGRIRRELTATGPADRIEVADPAWLAGWLAAADLLRLLDDRPDRIRPCANPACILHFHDVSRNGTRRWCSMAGCGNRVKASQHYARTRRRDA